MMNKIKNNKEIYETLGTVNGMALDKLKEEYNEDTAKTIINASRGQIKVQEVEINRVYAAVKADEHNKKYGSDIKIRDIESSNFK